MTKILFFEDDEYLGLFTKNNLESIGNYNVTLRNTGEDSLRVIMEFSPDICLVDIGLPIKDGLSIVEEMRAHGMMTPVIFLTARVSPEDAVRGFAVGGNDYVRKPFDIFELKARIESLTKVHKINKLQIADLEFDFTLNMVECNDLKIQMTPYEMEILEVLLRHKNELVTIDVIGNETGKDFIKIYKKSFYVTMSNLRNKLKHLTSIKIETLRKKGVILRIS